MPQLLLLPPDIGESGFKPSTPFGELTLLLFETRLVLFGLPDVLRDQPVHLVDLVAASGEGVEVGNKRPVEAEAFTLKRPSGQVRGPSSSVDSHNRYNGK